MYVEVLKIFLCMSEECHIFTVITVLYKITVLRIYGRVNKINIFVYFGQTQQNKTFFKIHSTKIKPDHAKCNLFTKSLSTKKHCSTATYPNLEMFLVVNGVIPMVIK